MKVLKVHLGERSYPILIGRKLLPRLGSFLRAQGLSGKILVATSRPIGKLYLGSLLSQLERAGFDCFVHFVPDGERAKGQESLFELYESLVRSGMERTDTLLALGGGTVGDVAGYAAATYLRGIAWGVVPTTLLAQVDSAIGGKTGINLPAGKNLIGSFHQPKLVVCDIELLKTLPSEKRIDSLAEVVKYGMIRGGRLFHYLERRISEAKAGRLEVLERIVYECVRIKKEIVEADERENKGIRSLLNYGHTFAHAFEGAASFRRLRHGQAVAVGMAAAGALARAIHIFSRSEEERQNRLVERAGLPTRLGAIKLSGRKILKFMDRDKKARGGKLRFILPQGVGKLVIRDDIPRRLVEKILRSL